MVGNDTLEKGNYINDAKHKEMSFQHQHLGKYQRFIFKEHLMRINIYSQELTSELALIEKPSDTGVVYSAVRLMLHSSPLLHSQPQDDDRSAVTFWLPKSEKRREELAQVFEGMAACVRHARKETGLD
jgi:hypothetical protein